MENINELLKAKLYNPYQVDGVKWMLQRELAESPGGVNADEVGLGKTIMTIATMIGNPLDKTLILAPKSLVSQWEKEFQKFAPHITPFINKLPFGKKYISFVTIASHSQVVKKDKKPDESEYHKIIWDRVIIDEGHVIKNQKTKIHKAVVALTTKVKWCLSATPVMNRLDEFVNIMSWIGPLKDECSTADGKLKIVNEFVMRRTKEDVAKFDEKFKLPKCNIQSVHVPLGSNEEKQIYSTTWETVRKEIKDMKNSEVQNNALEALERLLRMRQICIHPQIFCTGISKKRKLKQIEQYNGECSKLNKLIEILKTKTQEKSLVFCTFIEEMEIYSKRMKAEGLNVVHLDGSLTIEERTNVVNKFNTNNHIQVFLIQINTGGVGYNLQSAKNVFIIEPTWNPALEYQAIGRAHRTGQKNEVNVIKLITTMPDSSVPTVEEFIIQLQEQKLKMISEVLNDPRIANVEKGARVKKIQEGITFKDISKMFKA